jgi:DNA-binding MarR family transcriptional regulator
MAANRYRSAALFRSALRQFLRHSEQCAREHELTPNQYLLLLQIAGAMDGTSTISELTDRLALTQSAVTELVQRAELAGLVQRESSKTDGRVAHLTLTPLGEERLGAVHDALGAERARLRRVVEQSLDR